MNETSKSWLPRERRGDFEKYLRGSGIDVGCGADPLTIVEGSVRGWDMMDGDAQFLAGVPEANLDFVYSSHCLEHLLSVITALENWLRVLKPKGFLYVVVPDYVLYEKLTWPSRFNPEHRYSFSTTISREQVNRQNHYHIQADLIPLLTELGAETREVYLEHEGFDFNRGATDQTMEGALAQICFIAQKGGARAGYA